MSQLWEYVKIALFNIKSNKMRSLLTMLGIIIGISSVVLIVSAGNGIKNGISDLLSGLVGGQIELYSNSSQNDGITIKFTEEDIEYLREELPHLKGISPYGIIPRYCYIENLKGLQRTHLIIRSEDGIYGGKEMVRGRYFTKDECDAASKVCIINEADARTLYGTTDVIGNSVEISCGGAFLNFRIIGVRKSDDSKLAALFITKDVSLEIPYTVWQSAFGGTNEFSSIGLFPEESKYSTEVSTMSVRLMEARHDVRGLDTINVSSFESEMEEFNVILTTLTAFISAVAMISLLVGGIGIMNIMLVSVAERTREIGVRKALGAKTSYILLQFLMEGTILSLLGGIIGIVIGLVGAQGICMIASKLGSMNISADFSPLVIIIATAFSTAIGVFFTFYPARKAARLNPIEALRHE